MNRFYTPTSGPEDWRRLLADPARQWRATKSAYELAAAWEGARGTARGLPPDVAGTFDGTDALRGAALLVGFPEHPVALDGGGHASQTDLWALLATSGGLASLAVEAKAGEAFDRPVSEWLADASPRSGKPARLRQLCDVLGITEEQARGCWYQLLHRTVAAILEARRFWARDAVLLIQSFVPDPDGFAAYATFAHHLGVEARDGAVAPVGERHGVQLHIGWLTSTPAGTGHPRADV